jgi:hypothetical protein
VILLIVDRFHGFGDDAVYDGEAHFDAARDFAQALSLSATGEDRAALVVVDHGRAAADSAVSPGGVWNSPWSHQVGTAEVGRAASRPITAACRTATSHSSSEAVNTLRSQLVLDQVHFSKPRPNRRPQDASADDSRTPQRLAAPCTPPRQQRRTRAGDFEHSQAGHPGVVEITIDSQHLVSIRASWPGLDDA